MVMGDTRIFDSIWYSILFAKYWSIARAGQLSNKKPDRSIWQYQYGCKTAEMLVIWGFLL